MTAAQILILTRETATSTDSHGWNPARASSTTALTIRPAPGCALHLAALLHGEDPIDWKPQICWQVPLFFDSDPTTRTTMVRASRTADWGQDGIIDWWCTEQDEAFSAERPVYLSMEHEIRRVCGDDVYKELAAYCRARQRTRRPCRLALLPLAP